MVSKKLQENSWIRSWFHNLWILHKWLDIVCPKISCDCTCRGTCNQHGGSFGKLILFFEPLEMCSNISSPSEIKLFALVGNRSSSITLMHRSITVRNDDFCPGGKFVVKRVCWEVSVIINGKKLGKIFWGAKFGLTSLVAVLDCSILVYAWAHPSTFKIYHEFILLAPLMDEKGGRWTI